jgi:dTDP-4-dehydrorhamnose 3,5-epimerase
MKFIETQLKGAYIIDLAPKKDDRGLFLRSFCKKEFESIGHKDEFVQFNQSINYKKGTLRGLHFQNPPESEIKLIRCINGSAFDVIIDIRVGSPTFLDYFSTVLSKANMKMIYVPKGFAHGFLTLENDTELLYQHTSFYNPSAEGGLRYDDPLFKVEWPDEVKIISEKDMNYSLLNPSFKGVKI